MEIKAHAKFLRLSPRKARLVVDAVRGMKVNDAMETLKLMPKKAAHEIYKIIKSATANAEHNFGLSKNDLKISEIKADQGPTFKRYKPRARGSADTIRRKMTHLSVVLVSESGKKAQARPASKPEVIKEESVKKEKAKAEDKKKATKKASAKKQVAKKEEPKKEETKKSKPVVEKPVHEQKKQDHSFFGGIKKFFNRRGQ